MVIHTLYGESRAHSDHLDNHNELAISLVHYCFPNAARAYLIPRIQCTHNHKLLLNSLWWFMKYNEPSERGKVNVLLNYWFPKKTMFVNTQTEVNKFDIMNLLQSQKVSCEPLEDNINVENRDVTPVLKP